MNELPIYQVIDLSNPEIPVNRGAPCFSLEEAQQLRDATYPPERTNACHIFKLTLIQ